MKNPQLARYGVENGLKVRGGVAVNLHAHCALMDTKSECRGAHGWAGAASAVVAILLATLSLAQVPDVEETGNRKAAQFLLDELRDMNGVPGLSAAVATAEGLAWIGTSGWADVESQRPVRPGTTFRMASVSKLLAASLALRLWEDGVLDVKDNVTVFFDDLPESFDDVTLAHLASHTSGMAHYSGDDNRLSGHHYSSLVEALPIYTHREPLLSPGSGYTYSSWGYSLLGATVEKATDSTFSDALSQHVLEPLTLTNTFVEDTRTLPANTTSLYSLSSNNVPVRVTANDQSYGYGATGIRSTPADLVRFALAFASGRLVSNETRDYAWSPFRMNNGENAGEERFDIGFGWRIGRDWDNRSVVHHAGVTSGARSVLLLYPDSNVAVALLSNASWTSRIETTAELLAASFIETTTTDANECRTGIWHYNGFFEQNRNGTSADNADMGKIVIQDSDGLCVGRIEPRGSLADWLAERNAKKEYLAMGRIARREMEDVFAFVTPWGLSPLRIRLGTSGEMTGDGDIAGRKFRFSATTGGDQNH